MIMSKQNVPVVRIALGALFFVALIGIAIGLLELALLAA